MEAGCERAAAALLPKSALLLTEGMRISMASKPQSTVVAKVSKHANRTASCNADFAQQVMETVDEATELLELAASCNGPCLYSGGKPQ